MGDYNNPNDPLGTPEENPLGDIDPMAWLESLAIRQGASPEEMTTAADLDVPNIDPNSVTIDEPGYTPYEVFGQDTAQMQPPPDPAPQPPIPEPASFDPSTGIPDDIDPMAWLESLAKRQGVNSEELTTAANVDVPEIDPNSVVIDEPGYTPSETIRARHLPQPEPPTQAYDFAEAPSEPEPAPAYDFQQPPDPGQYDYSNQPPQEQYAEQAYAQPDPEQYNEQGYDWSGQGSQADQGQYAQQGDWLNQEYSQPADQGQYAQQEDWSNFQQEQQYPPAEPAYEWSPEPEAAPATSSFDPAMGIPDDIDPMAWLESLAKRQGVNSEELTTAANLDVPEIDPNSVVIDEPGYTPSETIRARHLPQPEPPAYEAPAYEDSNVYAESAPVEAGTAPWGEATDFLDSLTNDMEPLPGIDFGAAPEAVYGDASWLDSLGRESDDDLFGAPEPAPEADFSFLGEPVTPASAVEDAIPATHTPEEVMASIEGMSEEEIMRAQVERRLTPAQELAWLQKQAMSLQKAREEAEFAEVEDLDLPPAEAAEIPAWLQQSAVVSDEMALSAAFDDTVTPPPAPDDIPDWLHGDAAPQGQYAELELPDFTPEDASGGQPLAFEMPLVSDAGIGALNLEAYDPAQDEWAEALDEEHERISAGLAEDDPSWFRSAMEQASAEEAEEVAAPLIPTAPTLPVASQTPDWLAGISEDISEAPEVPDDLPDWLRPAAVAISSDEGGFDDIGTWLREEQTGGPIFAPTDMLSFEGELGAAPPSAPTPPAPPGEISVWLRGEESGGTALPTAGEQLKPARTGPLPEWLQGAELAQPPGMPTPMSTPPSAPPVAPRTVTPSARATGILTLPTNLQAELAAQPEAVQAAPVAPPPTRQAPTAAQQPAPPAGVPAPVPAAFEGARMRLEQNPEDHATRLQLARDLSRTGDLNNGLPQYQTLIERQGELDAVVEDLRGLIQVNPQNPVARRLLGDTYMRQGYLQQALDAYRGALDSL